MTLGATLKTHGAVQTVTQEYLPTGKVSAVRSKILSSSKHQEVSGWKTAALFQMIRSRREKGARPVNVQLKTKTRRLT